MDSVLIDTDVLSYLFKRDTRGELYKPLLDGKLGVISFMTIAELNFWANFRNWGAQRRAELTTFLTPYTLINSDYRLAEMWAEIRNEVMRNGHHIDTADCWIAATARLYSIPLVTHNRNHFTYINGITTVSA